MNPRNTKTSDTRRLLLNLSDKVNLKGSDKYVALSNLSIYCTWKSTKKSYKIANLKHQHDRGVRSCNYLMDQILYLILKAILIISSKNMRQSLIIFQ